MAEPSPSELIPGKLIASRFEVAEPIGGDRSRPAFTGVDREGGGAVLLVELRAEDVARLERARSASHAHMARLIDVVPTPNGGILVAEHVAGTSLAELIRRDCPENFGRRRALGPARGGRRVGPALHGAAHGWLDPSSSSSNRRGTRRRW